jgi:hypothetical protein
MLLKKSTWFFSAVCVSLLAVSSPARAEDKPSIEPRAERILKAAAANLLASKSFMFRGEIISQLGISGAQRLDYVGTVQVAVRRPDHVWTRVEGEQGRKSNWYDGKTYTHANLGANFYAVWPAPPTIEEFLDKMREKLGFTVPLSNLMRQDLEKEVFKGIKTGFYVGEAVVGGHACSHLAFTQENMDWQIWVDDVIPAVRRIALTYKKLPGSPQLSVTFTDWDFNATLPDSVFAFAPAPGMTRADFEIVNK